MNTVANKHGYIFKEALIYSVRPESCPESCPEFAEGEVEGLTTNGRINQSFLNYIVVSQNVQTGINKLTVIKLRAILNYTYLIAFPENNIFKTMWGAKKEKRKTSIVLSGGGARAAYQVGVLKAIAEMLPDDAQNPFDIICGTSAGAINAAALATHAYNFNKSVQRIHRIWSSFHACHVFKTDSWSLLKTSANWFIAMLSAGMNKHRGSLYLLNRKPLQKLLEQFIHSKDIQHSINKGYLHALSVTASGYTTQQSVSFFHGNASLQPWSRSRRIGTRAEITVSHLMASSAIPFIFSPIRLNGEFFGDGSMRQIAPISPALHLGAEKILIIGNRQETLASIPQHSIQQEPTIAQIAGHALDSIFLDSLSADIERLQRINKTIEIIPEKKRIKHEIGLRKVDVLVISPGSNLGELALKYLHELPTGLRFLLKSIGAYGKDSSSLASYLLFEKGYCRALIELGYQDAMAKTAEIKELLSLEN